MPIQTATTGNLEDVQRIVVSKIRHTAEHNAPMTGLIEKFTMGKGEKRIDVSKASQMDASSLTDGVDMTDTEDIGLSTVELTTSEVGLKIILTDKLTRQMNEDVFNVVGEQGGKAIARKKDKDILALFSALNSTGAGDLGNAGYDMELGNLSVLIGHAKANKFDPPVSVVHHPWATFHVATSTFGYAGGSMGGAAGAPLASDLANEMLKNYFEFKIGDVRVYQDGNITVDTSDDGIGAVFDKGAMCYVESVGFNQETERDASLRATELVLTCDYGVFELDDTKGAPCTFNCAAATT